MENGFTEIERKFLIDAFPSGLPLKTEMQVEQGYLSFEPEVRVRRCVKNRREADYFLTIKTGQGLVRREVELPISRVQFDALAEMAGRPFLSKEFRVYSLPEGLNLECSLVDRGLDSEFMYAEIEFPSREAAEGFVPLPFFLREVTDDPAYRMKNYWRATRG